VPNQLDPEGIKMASDPGCTDFEQPLPRRDENDDEPDLLTYIETSGLFANR
jgi:hypothetical protein